MLPKKRVLLPQDTSIGTSSLNSTSESSLEDSQASSGSDTIAVTPTTSDDEEPPRKLSRTARKRTHESMDHSPVGSYSRTGRARGGGRISTPWARQSSKDESYETSRKPSHRLGSVITEVRQSRDTYYCSIGEYDYV